jgi:nicotinamide riboside transporter PnuC
MKDIKKIIIIIITGVAILVTGIVCKQQFFLMVPLFISLLVMAFQSEANRVGALIGALNSIIYAAAYLYIGVYASAASAILFSFPIQLVTFFNWRKNAYKDTVIFKKMSAKKRVGLLLAVLACWFVLIYVFLRGDYEYAVLDSALFLLGFVIPILRMFADIEYTYLWIVQAVVSVLLSVQMVINDYRQLTYLIFDIYSFYCIICAFINVHKFYKEQQVKE